MWAASTAILLSLYGALVSAQDTSYIGTLINPPQRSSDTPQPDTNPVYAVGGVLNITWTSNASEVSVTIWQSVNDGGALNVTSGYLPNSKAITGQSYFTWDPIQVDGFDNNPYFDLALSNMFHFDIYAYPSGYDALSQSIWFNITNATVNAHGEVISTASASLSSTATVSASGSSHTGGPASASASSTSAVSSSASSSLTSSEKVGIGIGVGVGVPLLAALVVGAVVFSRRRQARHPSGPGPAYSAVQPYERDSTVHAHEKSPAELPLHPSELPAQYQGHEQQYVGELDATSKHNGPAELPTERWK